MKAIEVKKGDKVLYKGKIVEVHTVGLNSVTIKFESGLFQRVCYSQIDKYEQE